VGQNNTAPISFAPCETYVRIFYDFSIKSSLGIGEWFDGQSFGRLSRFSPFASSSMFLHQRLH
jgi:hypothetical protein